VTKSRFKVTKPKIRGDTQSSGGGGLSFQVSLHFRHRQLELLVSEVRDPRRRSPDQRRRRKGPAGSPSANAFTWNISGVVRSWPLLLWTAFPLEVFTLSQLDVRGALSVHGDGHGRFSPQTESMKLYVAFLSICKMLARGSSASSATRACDPSCWPSARLGCQS